MTSLSKDRYRKEKTLEVALKKWIKNTKNLRGEYTDNHAKLAVLIKGELQTLLASAERIPAENVMNLENLNELKQKHTNFSNGAQNLIDGMHEQLRNLIILTEDINGMEFSSDIPPSVRKKLKKEEALLEKCDAALLDLSKSITNYLRTVEEHVSDSKTQQGTNFENAKIIKDDMKKRTLLAFMNLQDSILATDKTIDSLFNILRENLNLARDLERSRIA